MGAPLAILVEEHEDLWGRFVYTNTSPGMGWDGGSHLSFCTSWLPQDRFLPSPTAAAQWESSSGELEISCPAQCFHSSGNIILIWCEGNRSSKMVLNYINCLSHLHACVTPFQCHPCSNHPALLYWRSLFNPFLKHGLQLCLFGKHHVDLSFWLKMSIVPMNISEETL